MPGCNQDSVSLDFTYLGDGTAERYHLPFLQAHIHGCMHVCVYIYRVCVVKTATASDRASDGSLLTKESSDFTCTTCEISWLGHVAFSILSL